MVLPHPLALQANRCTHYSISWGPSSKCAGSLPPHRHRSLSVPPPSRLQPDANESLRGLGQEPRETPRTAFQRRRGFRISACHVASFEAAPPAYPLWNSTLAIYRATARDHWQPPVRWPSPPLAAPCCLRHGYVRVGIAIVIRPTSIKSPNCRGSDRHPMFERCAQCPGTMTSLPGS
jgi:hypothetical protein